MSFKKLAAGAAAAAGLTAGSIGFASEASAQPIVTGGLVNVTLIDVVDVGDVTILEDVNVAAALALAANVCDVNVNVLAVQLRDGGAQCENRDTGAEAIIND